MLGFTGLKLIKNKNFVLGKLRCLHALISEEITANAAQRSGQYYSMWTALSVCVLLKEANTMQTIVAKQPVLYAIYIATQWGFWSRWRVQNSGLVVVEEWRFH